MEILTVCLDCGNKNCSPNKRGKTMGIWNDTCDMCGKKDVPCASAPHDFGIYSTKEIEADDEVQDLI
jgi:hypothetical protein